MFEEFDRGVSLRDLVTDVLRDGYASISQVGAALKERGIRLHRLAVAGYLKALADDGYLEERSVPPAKTYRLKPGRVPRSIYEVVAERVRQTEAEPAEATRLAVRVLQDLFHRPIFREELRRAGFEHTQALEEVAGEERQAARRVLSGTPLKLPFNDPAYEPKARGAEAEKALAAQSRSILAVLLREAYGVQSLSQTGKQARLTEVG